MPAQRLGPGRGFNAGARSWNFPNPWPGGEWGLPDIVVEAAAFHHEPRKAPATTITPLAAVHVAGAVARQVEAGDDELHLDTDYLSSIGIAHGGQGWVSRCVEMAEAS